MEEHKTGQQTLLIQICDQITAHFIYGLVIQMLLYSVCSIWLSYLPLTFLQIISTTHIFALYLAYTLSHTPREPSERAELADVIKDIKTYITSFSIPILEKSADQKNNAAYALKYLIALTCLYHIPAIIGIAAGYLVLCLSHGKEQAKPFLNIELLAYSSIYAFTSQINHPAIKLAQIVVSLVLLCKIYNPLAPKQETKLSYLNQLKALITNGAENLKASINSAADSKEKAIHILLATAIIMPIVQFLPLFSPIANICYSAFGILTQSLISTVLLGEKLERFFLPQTTSQDIKAKAPTPSASEYISALQSFAKMYITSACAGLAQPPI